MPAHSFLSYLALSLMAKPLLPNSQSQSVSGIATSHKHGREDANNLGQFIAKLFWLWPEAEASCLTLSLESQALEASYKGRDSFSYGTNQDLKKPQNLKKTTSRESYQFLCSLRIGFYFLVSKLQ